MKGIDIYDVTQTRVYGRYHDNVFSFNINQDEFERIAANDMKSFALEMHDAYSLYTEAKLDAEDAIAELDIEKGNMKDVSLALKRSFDTMQAERQKWIRYEMLCHAVEWFVKYRPLYKEKWLD